MGGDETQALRRRGERQCVAGRGGAREGVGVDELRGGAEVEMGLNAVRQPQRYVFLYRDKQ